MSDADRWVLVQRTLVQACIDHLPYKSAIIPELTAALAAAPAAPQPLTDIHGIVAGAAPAAPEPHIDGWPLYSGLPPAAPAAKPVTLADVLDALNQFNRPKPSEDDGPWEGGHFIRVDHLPDFINIIAAAWFAPAAESPVPLTMLTDEQIAALTIMLDHFAGDQRTTCLRPLVSRGSKP